MSTIMEEGSTIDSMLVYTSAILYLIALIAVATGMILDAVIRIRRVEKTEGLSKQKQQLKTQTQNTTQSLFI